MTSLSLNPFSKNPAWNILIENPFFYPVNINVFDQLRPGNLIYYYEKVSYGFGLFKFECCYPLIGHNYYGTAFQFI